MSQIAYTQNPAVAVEGLIADGFPPLLTAIASEVISFGTGVARIAGGPADDRPPRVRIPAAAIDVSTGIFMGIVRNEVTLESPGGYAINAAMGVLTKGRIWVLAEDAVTYGGGVFCRWQGGNEGKFRSDVDGANAVQVPGAKWASTTTGAGFAIVEINQP